MIEVYACRWDALPISKREEALKAVGVPAEWRKSAADSRYLFLPPWVQTKLEAVLTVGTVQAGRGL